MAKKHVYMIIKFYMFRTSCSL